MENQSKEYIKYENDRHCKNCGKPIPDHIHALTEFCEKLDSPDIRIKPCKDIFHSERNRIANQPFIELMNFQKTHTHNIRRLYEEKGASVTTADIDFYQIALDRAVRIEPLPGLNVAYHFIHFKLTQINSTQFNITTHENSF